MTTPTDSINSIVDTATLHNGVQMPWLGLGTFRASGNEAAQAVTWGLELGYRHLDTATIYANEAELGQAIRESGIPREEIFVTTKCWNDAQEAGPDAVRSAYEQSVETLGIGPADLYLLHWPVSSAYLKSWTVLESLYDAGHVRAIGVSNFLQHHLEPLLAQCRIVPMVDQLEHHPRLAQRPLHDYCKDHRIQYEAWAPLMKGGVSDIAEIQSIAHKYRKSPAQITLRWQLQIGVVSIPKSVHRQRIAENAQLFDFHLTEDEVQSINALDQDHRIGMDPNNF